ncbi:MAG: hypothetical protein HZB44_05065 [Actinobacteria bacterium]|nr:hypothetical protein [Actinomycetota bacterium]
MDVPVDWLLEGEPFIEYRTRLDLLAQSEGDEAVRAARQGMLADSRVVGLLDELSGWPGTVISSHKSASQPFHKLTFLADLGVRADDPGVPAIVKTILKRQSDEGPFQLPMNIAKHYGGSGKDEWAWALCDAPLIVYGLAKMGLAADPQVRRAVDYLAGLVRDNGWPCAVSEKLGKFRGPGRKDDPCPFANLATLKALTQFDDLRDGPAARVGAETILTLWNESRSRHPYLFYMGTDFRKLKAPFIWYDLLHVLDVLSRFPWLATDVRLLDMMDTLKWKADPQGRFSPESVWMPWKAWEFGQKKEPSRWVTMLAWRIIRMDQAAEGVL